jgi:hypothetical protein
LSEIRGTPALRERLAGLRQAKSGARDEIRRIEGKLQQVGVDSTLALQMISNVARKLHETAMAIVRTMG